MIIALGLFMLGLYLIYGSDRNVDALLKEHISEKKNNLSRRR